MLRGHDVELAADFFSFLVLTERRTSGFEGLNLLTLCGTATCPGAATVRYDNTLGRGVYVLSLPNYRQVQTSPSRWRIQLGARYSF